MEAVKFVSLLAFSFQLAEQDLVCYRIGMSLPHMKLYFDTILLKERLLHLSILLALRDPIHIPP
jgi:hypothetical protein